MYYVYFLLLKNEKTYVSLTDNLRRRINEHRRGKVKSTKNHRPFKFIGYEAYLLKSDATRREEFLKTTEGRHLFKKQYRDVLLMGFRSSDRIRLNKRTLSHSTERPVE